MKSCPPNDLEVDNVRAPGNTGALSFPIAYSRMLTSAGSVASYRESISDL